MVITALSIRQPWAWLIVNGIKDIDNSTWPTRFKGRCLIHAGKVMTKSDYESCMVFVTGISDVQLPDLAKLDRGGIIGEVKITGCFQEHESEWFDGPYGFAMEAATPIKFAPCRGAMGFFTLNPKVIGEK